MNKSTLADIASEIKTGKTPPTSNPDYFGSEINWYTPTDLDKSKIIYKSTRGITQKALDEKKATVIKPNSVLVGCIGDIGKIGLIKEAASCNQQITAILPNNKIIDSEFLYYWFKQNREKIKSHATSAIVPILNNKQLGAIKISYPSLTEQKHIAEVLSKAEVLIAERKQSIHLLDEYLKSTFLELFGDPVKNEKGWEMKKLKDLCNIRRGASPRPIKAFTGGNVSWIKIGDGTNGNDLYITETEEHITEDGASKSVLLDIDSLIFANCGVSLGFARILKIKGCIHDGWLSFDKLDKNLNQIFLLKLINHSTKYLRSLAPGGTQPNLNTGIMGKFKIILPPLKLQTKFAEIVEKAEASKAQYKEHLAELEQLYGALSQRAFKGELSKTEIKRKEKV